MIWASDLLRKSRTLNQFHIIDEHIVPRGRSVEKMNIFKAITNTCTVSVRNQIRSTVACVTRVTPRLNVGTAIHFGHIDDNGSTSTATRTITTIDSGSRILLVVVGHGSESPLNQV